VNKSVHYSRTRRERGTHGFAPQPKEETATIMGHVEWQLPDEKITYVEKY